MNYSESVISFSCEGDHLIGIASVPAEPTDCAVVIVVGGPQYRIGSHRQFVLLARFLAQQGITALRFDYRGMGDSTGALRDFAQIDNDLRAAVDALQNSNEKLKRIVLWGLCDAASAALFYAHQDARITGLVLANPWVRTVAGEAQAYLNHYYRSRLFNVSFWKKVLTGQFDFYGSLRSFIDTIKNAFLKRTSAGASPELPLREKMYYCWTKFTGNVLLIISGEDLTAKEFTDMVTSSAQWRTLLENSRVTTHNFPMANHTFARADWRNEVNSVSANWIKSL